MRQVAFNNPIADASVMQPYVVTAKRTCSIDRKRFERLDCRKKDWRAAKEVMAGSQVRGYDTKSSAARSSRVRKRGDDIAEKSRH